MISLHRISFSLILAFSLIFISFIFVFPYQAGASANTSPVSFEPVQVQSSLVLTIYFPIIFKTPNFVNGDFELGRNVGWSESSSSDFDLVVDEFPEGVAAHSGNWAAWLGGVNRETSRLSQSINIGSGAGLALFYYHRVESRESSCNFDYGYVRINGAEVSGTRIGLCNANEKGWEQRIVSLSGYSGNINVEFVATTDGSINSNYFIDDVSLIRQ